jgi:NADH:ubiquinone oxidoreductase subunit 3 (subunit A)
VQLLLDNYVAVLLATVIGSILVLTALIGSRVLAPFSSSRNKYETYECGMVPAGEPVRTQVHIRYYIFAILFLIFDVEAVFLFPWAVSLVGASQAVFYEMVLFLAIIGAGLAYAWKKGVLQWR